MADEIDDAPDQDDFHSSDDADEQHDAPNLIVNGLGGYFVPRTTHGTTHVAERKELLRRMGGLQLEEHADEAVDTTPPRATFDGVFNFRDLARVSPSKVRAGRVYRSGTPSEASHDDMMILLNTFNVKTIVDFREKSEAEADPGQRLYTRHFLSDGEDDGDEADDVGKGASGGGARSAADNLASPMSTASSFSAFSDESATSDGDPMSLDHARNLAGEVLPTTVSEPSDLPISDAAPRFRIVRAPYAPRSKMRNTVLGKMSYKKLAKVGSYFAMGLVSKRAKSAAHSEVFGVMDEMGLQGLYETILENSGAQIAKALRVIADRRNHPVLMHCSHGKDRTGLTACIIFMLVGVSPAAIVADYHLSEPHGLSDRGRSFFAKHPEMNADYWGSAPCEVMEGTIAYITATYGSIGRYLSHIGFDQGWQKKLLAALTDP